jgi:aldoxime dehydratase
MGGVSSEILEHGYWGSMRDRIPLSQTDTMASTGDLSVRDDGNGRVTVHGHENLAVIRSGQDWTDTQGEERRVYLEDIEPTLRAGMDFYAIRVPKSAATAIATCSTSTPTVAP